MGRKKLNFLKHEILFQTYCLVIGGLNTSKKIHEYYTAQNYFNEKKTPDRSYYVRFLELLCKEKLLIKNHKFSKCEYDPDFYYLSEMFYENFTEQTKAFFYPNLNVDDKNIDLVISQFEGILTKAIDKVVCQEEWGIMPKDFETFFKFVLEDFIMYTVGMLKIGKGFDYNDAYRIKDNKIVLEPSWINITLKEYKKITNKISKYQKKNTIPKYKKNKTTKQ